ncbi:ATP-dependent nuclease [Polaribacter sp. Asnod6-C07]|uniref:ATP-dependent nuclease n=1 Tax=Polaribacter sp. Asnod6-C07 TaxID=3160582 RepID=UPI00386EF7BD
MKIIIKTTNHIAFPKEFKNPEFYIDDLENEFLKIESDNTINTELEINKINFFVGENNSGKSRFLRGLIKLQYPFENISKNKIFSELITEIEEIERSLNNSLAPSFKLSNIIRITDHLISNYSKDDEDKITEFINDLNVRGKTIYSHENDIINFNLYLTKVKELQNELNFTKENNISNKIYIPILRSLLKTTGLNLGSFTDVVRTLYFSNKIPSKVKIDTGLDLWNRIYKLQNSPKKRNIEKFQFFLSKYFFNNKRVELLAEDDQPQLVTIAIDNKDFRNVSELGDGIQALIILLFPIFTASKNDSFYIEEPEMNLHPAFQKIFIETILNDEFLKKKNLKYFFTTHSNHLLDLTLLNDDISIFQFQKIEENKHLIKTNIKPNKETLDLLGVTASSVFLSNSSIWVEGPTDRKYLSKFLKLYTESEVNNKHLIEDIDFAFFEYGGNLIEHYLFDDENIEGEGEGEFNKDEVKEKINSFAISNKIFLLADNDNVKKGSKKDQRRIALKNISNKNKNFTYQNTDLKEIENLLPKKIIQDFMSEILKTEKSIQIGSKIVFSRNDYKKIGLGDFYENLFLNNKIPKKDFKVFKAESGTLKNNYKIKLASFVVDSNYSYSDLIEDNEELKNIIENLYQFIVK